MSKLTRAVDGFFDGLHVLLRPVTSRLSLAQRVTVLTATSVAVILSGLSISVYVLVRSEFVSSMDESMFERADTIVAMGYRPSQVPQEQASLLATLGIRLLALQSGGGGFLQHSYPSDRFHYADGEREVAIGLRARSARSTELNGVPYRVVAVQAGNGQAFVLAQSMGHIENSLDQLVIVLVSSSLAGVLLSAVAGWGVANNGLRPVRRLSKATERVARSNDLRPIPITGPERDELVRLSKSFNSMLKALEESQTRERQLIADAGHELRTPLTSLRTNVDLLRQASHSAHQLPEGAEEEIMNDIVAQVDELTTLVGDLTELARDEPLARDPEPIDFADVVEASIDRARRRAQNVEFRLDLQTSEIVGDGHSLERAVTNLLDNAVKWSPPGGVIEVRLRSGELTVTDEGPGINPADLPLIFDRFFRSDEARTLPGSGLGLSIVKRTAERHGGSVGVHSLPGKGSTFRLSIPVVPEQEIPA